MLTHEDIAVLKGLLGGRINDVRANKTLDVAEKSALVKRYEVAMHHLGDPNLLTFITVQTAVGA